MSLLLLLFVHWWPSPPPFLSLPSTRSILVLSLLPLLLLFFLFISSLFFSSFFTHVFHLLHSSLPSSSLISSLLFPPLSSFSKGGSYHNMSSIEAEIEETAKMSLKDA